MKEVPIIPASNPKVVDFMQSMSNARKYIHQGQSTTKHLGDGTELVGLLGEWQFSQEFGLPIDLSLKKGGDNHVDFYTRIGTIDVKTYRKPYHLLREAGKDHADILVMASCDGITNEVKLMGWEYDILMLDCEKKDFGYGIINHYKPADQLQPIELLKRILNK